MMKGRILPRRTPGWLLLFGVALLMTCGSSAYGAPSAWVDKLTAVPYASLTPPDKPVMQLLYQDYARLGINATCMEVPPITIGSKQYSHGLGTHANSRVRITSPEPITKVAALIGGENNSITNPEGHPTGSTIFVVIAGDKELYRSKMILAGEEAEKIEVDTGGANTIDLLVTDGGNGPACDWADWAEPVITTASGKAIRVDEIPQGVIPVGATRYPFSFLYDGKPSDTILDTWKATRTKPEKGQDGKEISSTTWTDPKTGLAVTWQVTRFPDCPAVDWVLHFENTGKTDTAIIENVQALDLNVDTPLPSGPPYRLHKTHGGTPDPMHYEPSLLVVDAKHPQSMDSGHGRSSGKDLPFFKVETGQGSIIAAVGWSGYWKSLLECQDGKHLHMTAGLDKTHFLLHPGEKVRSPRMLVTNWEGDTLEANAQFRQLIYKYYSAKRNGKPMLPIPFCNTCFTRGGGWLNECNAENQISLIKAYAKLGLEALLTDAGWFTGGWPAGAGNWDPRKDAYPNGMAPVALAAKQNNMIYGLWFEPERVVAGTTVQRNHPDWCLGTQKGEQGTYLLNFGRTEVQDYFFNIVKGFMELPGFRVYRQDFNMDPRPYWLYNDAPDRQGITEMKYIEGLYAYWDRLAKSWPDSLREECASGGHRMDLEVIQRLHIAQKTDYWFDYDVDQAALWGISQYLPNNCIVAHLNTMDDYSFHSTMASSLCLGWIADAPDFDVARGKELLGRYLEVRHLLIGAWYPLLPYSRDLSKWMAVQYDRPDLGEGMVLVWRRPESPYSGVQVSLHGIAPDATYELSFDSTGKKVRVKGADLAKDFVLTLPAAHTSDLIYYRRTSAGG
jgi:alpha-galactosidase